MLTYFVFLVLDVADFLCLQKIENKKNVQDKENQKPFIYNAWS